MKFDIKMDEVALAFCKGLKNGHNELIVPLDGWGAYVSNNANLKPKDIPSHMVVGEYVITEREWFEGLIRTFRHLYYQSQRLNHVQGAFWFAVKLEPKKIMPKHDIFDVGNRQSGSFRSNS